MPEVNFWRYEPLSERRKRQQAEFAQYAAQKQQETFAPVAPEPKKSLLSRALDVAKEVGTTALSGEKFVNVITPGDLGTDIRRGLEKVPKVGGALGTAFDIAAAPATLAIPGAGGAIARAAGQVAARGGAKGLLARAVQMGAAPISEGSYATKLGFETAAGTGAVLASEKAGELLEDAPAPVRVGGSVVAGLAGGVAGVGALKAAPRYFEVTRKMADAGMIPFAGTIKDVSGERATVPLSQVHARPDLFQARDVDGKSFDPKRVKAIGASIESVGYDPEKFRIEVVPDPDGGYVVTAGHHRLQYATETGMEEVPVLIRGFNIADPEDMKLAQQAADISNYVAAENSFADKVGAFLRAKERGMDTDKIAAAYATKPSEVEATLDASLLGPNVIRTINTAKSLQPIASEIGRGMRVYGIPQEEAVALFERSSKTDVKGAIPSQTAMKQLIDRFGRVYAETANQAVMPGFEGLEGMGKGRFLDMLDQYYKNLSAVERSRNEIKRATTILKKVQGRSDATPKEIENAASLLESETLRLNQAQEKIDDLNRDFEAFYRNLNEDVAVQHFEDDGRLREGVAGLQEDMFGKQTTVYEPNLEKQAEMGIGSGERPIDDLPMFADDAATVAAPTQGGVPSTAVPPSGDGGAPPTGGPPPPRPDQPTDPMNLPEPPRKGELLNAPTRVGLEAELGRPYTVKDIYGNGMLADNLQRVADSQKNRLKATVDLHLPVLGKISKGTDGNLYLDDIPPAPADLARGMKAPLQRVAEMKSEYDLTPEQSAAIDAMSGVEAQATHEMGIFGVEAKLVDVEEGNNFFHRIVKKLPAGDELEPRISGRRMSVGKLKSRYYEDPGEFIAKGGVYGDLRDAIDASLSQKLSMATNQHLKDLLEPFAGNAFLRVPPGLRAQMEGLQQKIGNLVGTAERLDTREHKTLNYYLGSQIDGLKGFAASNEPHLDNLRTALDKIVVGLSATKKAGPNLGKGKQQILEELRAARKEMRGLAPDWHEAVALSKSVPPGREIVPSQYATALTGWDFSPEDAKRITNYYARGHTPPNQLGQAVEKIKVANAFVIPLRAIGDASALFNQLATLAVNNPIRFVQAAARSLRFMFDDAAWAQRLRGEDAALAAQHGIVIMGKAGQRQELQLRGWLEHIPGFREAAKHFERVTSDMRITVFNDYVDAAMKAGRPLDDLQMDQLGRAMNRLTGISSSRAGDVEAVFSFAPHFTRSYVENIVKAVSDGSLEGHIARTYLRNYVATMMTSVGVIALIQGRDLMEVWNPLSTDALARGELRMNPNFGTIKFAGQTTRVFGAYDSLARLLLVQADAVRGAISEQDAMQLFDGIGYATATKGSPVIGFATDLVKGETWMGDEPLSLSAMAQRFMPFTFSAAMQDWQHGAAPQDVAASAAVSFVGAKSNPLSLTERLNQVARRMYGGDFYDLEPNEQLQVKKASPELWEKAVSEGSKKRIRNEELKEQFVALQQVDDDALLAGKLDRAKWVKNYQNRRAEVVARRKELYEGSGGGGDKKLKPYFDVIDEATGANGAVNWEAVDAWMATQDPAMQDYIDRNVGLGGTVLSQAYRALQPIRDEYFNISPYRGYTAEEARKMDVLYTEARSRSKSAEDGPMLRALRQVVAEQGLAQDDPTVKGVRRLILGIVKRTKEREKFRKEHPEIGLLDPFVSATLTKEERVLLQAITSRPEIVQRAS